MFLWFMQPDIWLTLITLTFLEIILGVDNIIFLSLVVAKLPLSQQNMAPVTQRTCIWKVLTNTVAGSCLP